MKIVGTRRARNLKKIPKRTEKTKTKFDDEENNADVGLEQGREGRRGSERKKKTLSITEENPSQAVRGGRADDEDLMKRKINQEYYRIMEEKSGG